MPTRSLKINAGWKKAVLLAAAVVCVITAWFFARWGMANSAAGRADDPAVASILTDFAPDDPQTHYAAAILLEKSFDPADIAKAIHEYETATALSPENYLYWFELGRARERSGDSEGAERALRRALELAPNYSRVQWALGNALLRQGRVEEAFVEIKKAVAAEPTAFTNAAAATAWQFFDGDIAAIRSAVGDSPRFDAALALMLAQQKRFDDAMQLWRSMAPEEKRGELAETGQMLVGQLMSEGQYRSASQVLEDVKGELSAPRVGQVTNGGFESAVRPDNPGPFDWQIAAGLQPQIVLTTAQKHGGNNSLLLIFNSSDGKDFRTVSQVVALAPRQLWELGVFYRAELKTMAAFKWEVADARTGKRLALSDAIQNQSDWASLHVKFATEDSDGVVIRLVRDGCGQVCPVVGSLWFDDISVVAGK